LRLGVQSTTGDNHDQQAKKEGKQESKQAGGVCGGTPDYDGKIKGILTTLPGAFFSQG
jgi:hypothetical protein